MDQHLLNSILSIHRHWQWADWTKEEFEYHLKIDTPDSFSDDNFLLEFYNSSTGKSMILWYALLYAACEGIQQLYKRDYYGNIVDIYNISREYKEIENDLRRFRNATFHVQEEYYSTKFMNILKVAEYASKIRRVHKDIGDYVLNQVNLWGYNPSNK